MIRHHGFAFALVMALAVPTVIRAQTPSRITGARPPLPGASAGVVAFVNVGVVPMDTNRALPNHTVLVEGGWITALGPAGKVQIPAGATKIDGQGKYLMPGLADMHVHLTRDAETFDRRMIRYLDNGVTTVRNMDHVDPNSDTTLWLRAQVAAGKMLGPRIYTSGSLGLRGKSLADIAPQVERYKAAGYDFVKVYTWDSAATFDSIVAATRRVGIPFAGHTPGGVSIRRAVAAGMRSIEHNTGYWDSEVGGLAALAAATRQGGTWNCPTAFYTYPPRVKAVQALHAAGAGLLLGTDTPEPDGLPGFLSGFTKVGLTPFQALLTGTRNVAEYFGTLDEAGTLAVGKRADLVLLNGNPLEDVWHTTYPAGVMAAGRWLPREELDRLRNAAERRRSAMPYMYYWRSLGMDAFLVLRHAGLDDRVKMVGQDKWVRVADSLSWDARSKAGHQRMFELLAQLLGETRATLTPGDQPAFDEKAREWLTGRERDGYRMEIPDVSR